MIYVRDFNEYSKITEVPATIMWMPIDTTTQLCNATTCPISI